MGNETGASAVQSSRSWALFQHLGRVSLWRQLLLVAVITLLGLLLAGCTRSTSLLREIYVLSLSYPILGSATTSSDNGTASAIFIEAINTTSKLQEVRIGYFGLCVLTNSNSWMCSSSPSNLVGALKAANQTDPLNLVWVGNKMRTEVISSALIFIAILFVFGTMLLGLAYTFSVEPPNTPKESRVTSFLNHSSAHAPAVTVYAIVSMIVSTASTFVAALWQHFSSALSSALSSGLTFEAVECRTGPVALAFGWVSFSLAGCGILSLVMEKRAASRRAAAQGGSEATVQETATGEERLPPLAQAAQRQLDMEILYYFAGLRNARSAARQHATTTWVEQVVREVQVPQGFAETIVDDNQTRV